MRIAYLCSDFGIPICGDKGAAVHVRALSQALQDLGHELLLVTPRMGSGAPEGFTVPVRELSPDPIDALAFDQLRAGHQADALLARDGRTWRRL